MAVNLFAEFVDYPMVYVVDQKYRPIKGAQVTVSYQSSENKYVTSLPVETDDFGKAELRVVNLVKKNPDLYYTLTLWYFDYTDSQEVKHTGAPVRRHFIVPVNQFTAYISSIDGAAKYSANILGIEKNSSKGNVWYHLPPGEYVMNITYKNQTIQKQISMDDIDQQVAFSINEYMPMIEIVDDKGNHLNGVLTVCGKEFNISSPQKIMIVCSPEQQAEVDVYTKTITQTVDLSQDKVRFVFDVTRPLIREVVFYADKESWGVTLDAYDPGLYPSGIKDNIEIKYSILRANEKIPIRRTSVLVYDKATGKYRRVFQYEKPGTYIDITITIQDNSENIEQYSTGFTVGQDAKIIMNKTTDANNGKEGNNGFGIDIGMVIGGIVVILIIAGIIVYFKTKQESY